MSSESRIHALRSWMEADGLSLCVVNSPENMQYLSGFQAITYSRPIMFVIAPETTVLIIPALEEAHAKVDSHNVKELRVYYEHPEKASIAVSAMDHLKTLLRPGMRVGVEYRAMSISMERALLAAGVELFDLSGKLVQMRSVKDARELEYIREGGRLCQYAFEKSLEHARAGITEMEFEQPGTEALYRLIDRDYPYAFSSPSCITPSGPERTVMPHVFSSARRFQDGDMVIHVRKPAINGYHAELERTFFIGKPTVEAKKAFCAMAEAQQAVLQAIRPGLRCCDLDKIGRDVLRRHGFEQYAIHRIGHGQGLGRHEEPYLSFNSELIIRENMVFTVEPGIYIPGVGGFRHSDTVIVTADGCENTTDFRRTLEELTF